MVEGVKLLLAVLFYGNIHTSLASNYTDFSAGYGEMDCPQPSDITPEMFYSSQQVALGETDRAMKTIPERWFRFDNSSIPDAGLGVFASTFIPAHTWLGEYEGTVITREEYEDVSKEYAWSVTKYSEESFLVDAYYEEESNWLRFINCPRTKREENVKMSMCFGKIYYGTFKDLAPGMELMVYYGDDYAKDLGIDTELFRDE